MSGTDTAHPGMDYMDLLGDLDAGRIAWDSEMEGVRAKVLQLTDDLYVAIEQWDAGFTIPFLDKHGGHEYIYVIRGSVTDENGTSDAGPLQCFQPDTSHRPGTKEGSTTLVFRSLAAGEREGLMAYYKLGA